jgi:hypothetical protein
VTTNSFASRANDHSMKGLANICALFKQVEAAIFDGG